MNIIEIVKSILQEFPKISEVCNDIHIDFTESEPTNYGLLNVGDTLVKEDVLGNQLRQHNFVLYAVWQSINDYDRMANSGVLLELQMWLENQSTDALKIACENGMIYDIPDENMNSSVRYQLQIQALYKIESED